MEILIPVHVLARIREEASQAYPDECCGLLIGHADGGRIEVIDLAPAANIATDPRRHFELDPAVHVRFQRDLRGTGRGVVGHFHSHPGAGAEPSGTDVASISDPRMIWVIAAVDREARAGQIRAWQPAEDRNGFREIPLRTV